MARNRYAGDYRLLETFDERGRGKTTYEYIGAAYVYEAPPNVVRRSRQRFVIGELSGILAFIMAFVPFSTSARTLYIALPAAFQAIPLALLADLIFSMIFWKEPLERRQADKPKMRMRPAAFFLSALAGVSLIGVVLRMSTGGVFLKGDAVFVACEAVLCIVGVVLYRMAAHFTTRVAGAT